MKRYILLPLAITFLMSAKAQQQQFLQAVSIDYEKTVAVWGIAKEDDPEWFDRYKSSFPQNSISWFNFTGDNTRSIYKQIKPAEIERGKWYRPIADENKVYTDYTTGTNTILKPVFEETYLIQDSLLKIKWKYTPDTRNIAGFNCKKAIGILADTIAIFAFYTDEIPVSGGPESIHGLPGMILGVGIPRLHTTWFATRVSLASNLKDVTPPLKGKKSTRQQLNADLMKSVGRWGTWGKRITLFYAI